MGKKVLRGGTVGFRANHSNPHINKISRIKKSKNTTNAKRGKPNQRERFVKPSDSNYIDQDMLNGDFNDKNKKNKKKNQNQNQTEKRVRKESPGTGIHDRNNGKGKVSSKFHSKDGRITKNNAISKYKGNRKDDDKSNKNTNKSAGIIQGSKKETIKDDDSVGRLYNQIVQKKTNENEKHKKIDQLLKNSVEKMIMNHKGSRAVQACYKYGSATHKRCIISSLKSVARTCLLDGNPYSAKCIYRVIIGAFQGKDIKGGNELLSSLEVQQKVFRKDTQGKAERGKLTGLVKIAKNKTGLNILSALYDHESVPCRFKKRLMFQLTSGLVGAPGQYQKEPEYIVTTLAALRGKDLTANEVEGEKENVVPTTPMWPNRRLIKLISLAVEKELLHCSLIHRILYLYLNQTSSEKNKEEQAVEQAAEQDENKDDENVESRDLPDRMEPLLTELLPIIGDCSCLTRLLSTRQGVLCFNTLFGYLSPKNRKIVIKELKGNVSSMCVNKIDYMSIIRILECTDDTVLVNKGVISAFDVNAMISDKFGSVVLIYCLGGSGKTKRYYPPSDYDSIFAPTKSLKTGNVREIEISEKIYPLLEKSFCDIPSLLSNEYAVRVLTVYSLTETARLDIVTEVVTHITSMSLTTPISKFLKIVLQYSCDRIQQSVASILINKGRATVLTSPSWLYVWAVVCRISNYGYFQYVRADIMKNIITAAVSPPEDTEITRAADSLQRVIREVEELMQDGLEIEEKNLWINVNKSMDSKSRDVDSNTENCIREMEGNGENESSMRNTKRKREEGGDLHSYGVGGDSDCFDE